MRFGFWMASAALLLTSAMPTAQVITIKGSDTMVILSQKWAETYAKKTGAEFQVTGGGSGTGFAALINGTTDICSASRPIKPAEIKQLKEKYKSNGVEIRVARDGISIYLNKKNPVSKLTIQQIRDIYTGKTENWKDLGGPDMRIVLYGRENNSGTYDFFKEHVLNKQDFDASTQHMPGTAAVVNAVAKDKAGVGFGGSAYAKDIKDAAVATGSDAEYVMPTEDNILSGKYPISRFLYFYVRERPSGNIKKFIDWILGNEGQKVVKEVGYFPLKKRK